MTKRCRHEFEMKEGYPDDVICQKCQSIWTVTDYLDYSAKQLMILPFKIRQVVLFRQAKEFQKQYPDFYKENN